MNELTIAELQANMQTGELTAHAITETYLRRIGFHHFSCNVCQNNV